MKTLIFIFILILGLLSYSYFKPSFRYSLEAKYFYETGNYKKAYQLAKEAYNLDPYNRMAFTIYTQAPIAEQYMEYINSSKKYFREIENIANKENITKADKLRIKMMLEIIIDGYKTLKPSKLISNSLKAEAKDYYKKAEDLYESVYK